MWDSDLGKKSKIVLAVVAVMIAVGILARGPLRNMFAKRVFEKALKSGSPSKPLPSAQPPSGSRLVSIRPSVDGATVSLFQFYLDMAPALDRHQQSQKAPATFRLDSPGSFIAYVYCDGCADTRVPFRIVGSEDIVLNVMMLRKDAVPEGMVYVPEGEFILGGIEEEDEKPGKPVFLPGFLIDRYEVTNDQYAAFVEATGHRAPAFRQGENVPEGKGWHPVTGVSWGDANAYAAWTGKRLPTEMEWEKAARGVDGRRWPWGNKFDGVMCNSAEMGAKTTVAVWEHDGVASPYGCVNMAGNVWEWTADWYKAYKGNYGYNQYAGEMFRVTRGGAFNADAKACRCSNRWRESPDFREDPTLGFRCAKDLPR
jgi:formylglycine-generating enzyme required for sulfatase activity